MPRWQLEADLAELSIRAGLRNEPEQTDPDEWSEIVTLPDLGGVWAPGLAA